MGRRFYVLSLLVLLPLVIPVAVRASASVTCPYCHRTWYGPDSDQAALSAWLRNDHMPHCPQRPSAQPAPSYNSNSTQDSSTVNQQQLDQQRRAAERRKQEEEAERRKAAEKAAQDAKFKADRDEAARNLKGVPADDLQIKGASDSDSIQLKDATWDGDSRSVIKELYNIPKFKKSPMRIADVPPRAVQEPEFKQLVAQRSTLEKQFDRVVEKHHALLKEKEVAEKPTTERKQPAARTPQQIDRDLAEVQKQEKAIEGKVDAVDHSTTSFVVNWKKKHPSESQ